MRILFLGSPEFACPPLQALHDSAEVEVIGTITKPDKPSGRGQKLQPTPVKALSEKLGVPVLQPSSLKGLEYKHGSFSFAR